jgi:RNA polymerase sigma-70 factor (ECF subfamily)
MFPTPTLSSPPAIGSLAAPAAADEDAPLVQQAQKNLWAFDSLYQRHVHRVYRYLLVRLGSQHEAQLLTAQTFQTAQATIRRYPGQGTFAGWLLGIARQQVANHIYRRGWQPEQELSNNLATFDKQNGRAESAELVADKLQRLPADRAEALALRLFGGLEMGEIARLMVKQEDAVRLLVHNGLLDLQCHLQPSQATTA